MSDVGRYRVGREMENLFQGIVLTIHCKGDKNGVRCACGVEEIGLPAGWLVATILMGCQLNNNACFHSSPQLVGWGWEGSGTFDRGENRVVTAMVSALAKDS